jgi:integrase
MLACVIKAAGVRRIKVHGFRHTSAMRLSAAGEPVHVVAARLGHAKVTTTLEIYAHALPAHGQAAARTLGGLLYANG